MEAGQDAPGRLFASQIQLPPAREAFVQAFSEPAMYAALDTAHALKVAKKVKLRKNIWFLNVN
jgi:hypothetical protein